LGATKPTPGPAPAPTTISSVIGTNVTGVTENSTTSALTLSGTNTYTAGTTISAGTLTIGSAGQLGSGSYAGNISDAGTFVYGSSAAQTLSGLIFGVGALTVNVATTLTLSDANTYSGATAITTGTLVLDNALAAQNSVVTISAGTGSTGANNGLQFQSGLGTGDAFTIGGLSGGSSEALLDTSGNNVALTIGNNNNTGMTYSGSLSAGGSLTKVGTGTQTLTGSNAFTGGLTIENGTVLTSNLSNNDGLGNPGSTVYLGADSNSATLVFAGGSGNMGINQNIVVASGGTRTIQASNNITTTNGIVDLSYTITLNGNLDLAETGGGNIQLRGNITGPGNNVIIDTNNTGAVEFRGANTFSNLIIKAGYVTEYDSATAFGTGTITLGDSTTTSPVFLILEGGGSFTPANAISLASGATNSSLTIGLGTSNKTNQFAGINNGGFSGAITLNGNNLTILDNAASTSTTAAGSLTMNGGVTGTGNLTINNNSTNTSVTAGNTGAITLSSTEINNIGTITNSGTANSTAGSVLATTISAEIGSNVSNITQNSTTSNLVLSGVNTAAGGFGATGGAGTVTVSDGTLQMGGASALGAVNAVSVGTSGTFDLNGNSETIAGLSNISGGGGTVTNSGAAKTLTLGGSGSYTFGGTITATTPANLALNVNMTGTQTLSGASAYTGATSVQNGTLIVSGSLSGSASASVASGGTLEVDGSFNNAATTTLNATGALQGTGLVGAITAHGGTVAPGLTGADAAITSGTLTAAGAVSLSSTTNFNIRVGVAGTTDGDQLAVTNGASVSLNGTLNISLGAGLNSLTAGTTYNLVYIILQGNQVASGTFSSFTINGSAATQSGNVITSNGYTVDIDYGYASGGPFSTTGSTGDDVAIELVSVPEPGTWAMMLGGMGMLAVWQSKRRRR
jgi:autotransporter-associated beta strand protein